LATDKLFEFGNADLVLIAARIVLEERRQTLDDSSLPVSDELGLQVMLAAKFGLVGGAGQQLKDDLSFEFRRERSSSARHEKIS
jgi:hypothetical protein